MSTLKQIAVEHIEAIKASPDALGEVLRAWAFLEEYGCYSCFDLRPEFEEAEPTPREFAFLWGRAFDPTDNNPNEWDYCDVATIKKISWFKHPNGIEVGWYWDGDGTLGFFVPELADKDCDGSLSNSDCKCSYGWSFGDQKP